MSINAHGPSGPSHGSKIISLERRGEFTGLSLVRKRATESHNKEKHHCFNKWLWLLHRRSGDLGFWDWVTSHASRCQLLFHISHCYESRHKFLAQVRAFYFLYSPPLAWQPESLCWSPVLIQAHILGSDTRKISRRKNFSGLRTNEGRGGQSSILSIQRDPWPRQKNAGTALALRGSQ